jgi:hypothetical protein
MKVWDSMQSGHSANTQTASWMELHCWYLCMHQKESPWSLQQCTANCNTISLIKKKKEEMPTVSKDNTMVPSSRTSLHTS